MAGTVITCGVYGFTAETFAEAVRAATPDIFVDIRRRRGVRGSQYTFGNNLRLQAMLVYYDIPYIHRDDLAAPAAAMLREVNVDKARGIARHDRDSLSSEFVADYDRDVLQDFDAQAFINSLGDDVKRPLLFCVERTAGGCHRGLVADAIVDQLGWERLDIEP